MIVLSSVDVGLAPQSISCDRQSRSRGCMVTGMRWALAPVIALSACYSPTFSGGAPCVVGRDSCPTGQTCVAMGSGGVCTKDGSNGVDSGTDTSHPDGATCLGVHLLGDVCLQAAPTAA